MVFKKKGRGRPRKEEVDDDDIIDEPVRKGPTFEDHSYSESDIDMVKKAKPYFITKCVETIGQLTSFQYDQKDFDARVIAFLTAFSQAFYATISDVKDLGLRERLRVMVTDPTQYIIKEKLNSGHIYEAAIDSINVQPLLALFYEYMKAMTEASLYSTIQHDVTEVIGYDDQTPEQEQAELEYLRSTRSVPESDQEQPEQVVVPGPAATQQLKDDKPNPKGSIVPRKG